jgi:hypothetical protein
LLNEDSFRTINGEIDRGNEMTLTVQMQFAFKDVYDRERTARILEIVASGLQMKTELEKYYSNEENFRVTKEGDTAATFPDGNAWAECTSWAVYVRRIEGKSAKLYGFDSDENPDSEIAKICGGHDFAVVDNRFLVDGWAVNVEGMSKRAVFDLYDLVDIPEIHRLYGDPIVWLASYRSEDAEEAVDQEPTESRIRAMRGVVPRV